MLFVVCVKKEISASQRQVTGTRFRSFVTQSIIKKDDR